LIIHDRCPSSFFSSPEDSGSEGVSSSYTLVAILAALQACLLYFCGCNFMLRAWFAYRFTVSLVKLASRDTLRA
jgi:hypothetical protein